MKTSVFHSRRGSALVTVMMFAMALMLMVGTLLSYSLAERRFNYREAMRLEARNAAEAISEYGLAQVRQLMDSRSDFSSTRFTSNEGQISKPPTTFWGGTNVSTYGSSAPELIIGLVNQVTSSSTSGLYYFDPADPNNEFEPLKGRYAFRFDIRVLSKATVSLPGSAAGPPQTCYMTQTLSARASPLFSHAIFYNMDLELWPGPAMNILGGVHTNGNLFVKKQSSSGLALNFVGPVTVAGGGNAPPGNATVPVGLYSGVKCPIANTNGTSDDLSSYTDNTYFTTPAGGLVGLYGPAPNTTSPSFWRDQKWGQATESTTTDTSFRNWSSQTFGGNLQTAVHGVQVANPPGITSVASAHKMIEPPLASTDTGYDADVEAQKYSRQCGLYIVVNPSTTTRTGRLPNGNTVSIPGFGTTVAGVAGFADARYHYRVFRKDGTEVVLPGQPDYGANNATANATGNLTGPAIVWVRGNEMYDMRRATRADGTTFSYTTARSASNAYTPKQIDCIDIDMTALKLAVDKTINALASTQVYYTAFPAAGSTSSSTAWTGFIYNNIASGTGASVLPAATALSAIHNINIAGGGTMTAADWNGGIYIESIDATSRKDSGVRLINGRGKAASEGNEGLTIATNDALYILGHYNANGFIDQTTTAGNTTNNGRFPDDANETPCSIVCDALTILSTPTYTISGTTISQSMGHNDALSRHRNNDPTSGYTSSWATTPPSSSNRLDGIDTSVTTVYKLPYDSASGSLTVSATTCKLPGAPTEISAAFLAGIVQSNAGGNGQNSGGANNYPRFNEDFSASGTQSTVCIRGSIVAMYDSAVAVEPWNWRTFNAPARLWGFNELFNQGRFPPLTPRVMSYRRVDFNDIDVTAYNAAKTSWGL